VKDMCVLEQTSKHCIVFVYLKNTCFFGGSGNGVWIQSFILAGQVHYNLNHAYDPFSSGYFGDRVSVFAQTSLDIGPPAQIFSIESGSHTLICLGRFWTVLLLILVPLVARIIGMSHGYPPGTFIFVQILFNMLDLSIVRKNLRKYLSKF
jgi:hypothetical protein